MRHHTVSAFGPPGYLYECPRWHDGRWWATDMRGRTVYSYSADGEARVELTLADDRPGGLGWTAEGDLLVVSMERKLLLRRAKSGGGPRPWVDLAPLAAGTVGFLNDMGVSRSGHAYIGFDSDPNRYDQQKLGMVLHVDPDGRSEIVARGLAMPNGIVFSPDESTLVVAETMVPQLTQFSIQSGGSLGPARPWAVLHPRQDRRASGEPDLGSDTATLDGCAMDAEGRRRRG